VYVFLFSSTGRHNQTHIDTQGYAAKRSRWLSSLILKANKQREVQCITKAIHGPSFRKFLTVMKISAAKRLKVFV